jgi:hypothetical protein
MVDNLQGFPGQPAHPRARIPVRGIGKADPPQLSAKSTIDDLMGAVQADEMGRLLMDPGKFADAPPWALETMNTVRRLHVEVATLMLALKRRGLLTIEEIVAARQEINAETQRVFQQTVAQLDRVMRQRPGPADPGDPRRAPPVGGQHEPPTGARPEPPPAPPRPPT